MVTFTRRRGERGFTLIELLVVMIIISILMAVAIPVFLGQKQKALATAAKTNAKHVQDTLESCAAGTITGTFTQAAAGGGTAFECRTASTITQDEPSLSSLFSSSPPLVVISPPAGSGPDDYTVTSMTANGASDQATFTITRSATAVIKTCSSASATAKQRMCPTGTW